MPSEPSTRKPLAIALPVAGVLVAAFLYLAAQARSETQMGTLDQSVGKSLEEIRIHAPLLKTVLMGITLIGAFEANVVLVPLVAIFLFCAGKRILAAGWLIAGVGAGLMNHFLKRFYDRPRPDFKDEWVYESNESFPSGHASGAMVVFGMVLYLLLLHLAPGKRKWAVVGIVALILLIGFSRIFLGAHYLSDVLGGYALGGAWLVVVIGVTETLRRRKRPGTAVSS